MRAFLPALLRTICAALLLAAWAVAWPAADATALDVPKLSGRVIDLAGLLSPQARQRIDALAAELERSDSTQVAVLTVPSLQGEVLEEYAVKVAQAWGLGRKDYDNGVLLLVAKAEREVRIEVGYGLEGRLTDLLAGRIVDREVVPRFKMGDFDGGVLAGVQAVAQAARGEYKAPPRQRPRGASGPPAGPIIMFLLIAAQFGLYSRWVAGALGAVVAGAFGYAGGAGAVAVAGLGAAGFGLGFMLSTIFSAFRGPRGPGSMGPSGTYLPRRRGGWIGFPGGFGGGGGGGGFDGGGFSGGGGGFGGGGASGKW